jgi:RNA polymerase sigma-70 factor (ECF subfamily)
MSPAPADKCALDRKIPKVDAEDFGIFVAAHQSRIFRFILKGISNISIAEELTQETFLAAYRSLNRFKGESKLSTWVTGIALNLVRNHLNRSDEQRCETVSDEWFLNRIDGGGDPLQHYEKKEFLKGLHGAIAALPADLREALILVAMEGLSYSAAAEVLGIAEGTVKSRVFRAREKMRELMKELFPQKCYQSPRGPKTSGCGNE